LPQLSVAGEPPRPGPAAALVCPVVRIPRLVAAVGLTIPGDLPVDGLVAPADPDGDRLDLLTAGESSAISIRSSWLRYLELMGTSTKLTQPASMNHSDPQLSDTPTRSAA
jgi:hypothetical protein